MPLHKSPMENHMRIDGHQLFVDHFSTGGLGSPLWVDADETSKDKHMHTHNDE